MNARLPLAHAVDEVAPASPPELQRLLSIDQRLVSVLVAPGSVVQAAPRIVGAFCQGLGWTCGALWMREADAADRLRCVGAWGSEGPGVSEFLEHVDGRRPILHQAGVVGAAWLRAAPVWVADTAHDDSYRRVPIAVRAGLRAALALPATAGPQVIAVLELHSTEVRERDDALLAGLRLLGAQVAQFLLRAQLHHQLSESEKRLRSLTALSSDWFWEQDARLGFVRFEGRGVGRSGAALAPRLIGRRPWEVEGAVPVSCDWDAHRAALERREPVRDFEYLIRLDGGETVHLCARGDAIVDADGGFGGYRGVARDVSFLKQAAQRVQYLSTHDELTGLPNRAALRQLVQQAIELAKRYQRRFALLLLDLDRFERINAGFGRDAGDALLRDTAQRLRKLLRASDVVARLDGDTFAVLAHELPAPEQAEPVARKLLQALGEPVVIATQTLRVSACAGIAVYPHDAADEASLMHQAERALRAAKRAGAGSLRSCEPPAPR